MLPMPVKPNSATMLLALALSLSGCAAPSPQPPVAISCPAPPPAPQINQPLLLQSYSERARLKFKSWQESLTVTHPTSGR